MKNKIIRFDDRLYWTISYFTISILSLLALIFLMGYLPIWGFIVLGILFPLSLAAGIVFPKMGIKIDYKLGILKCHGIIKFQKPIIKLKDIKNITFVEISKKRKKFYFDHSIISSAHDGMIREPDYVYRNGKVFKFTIELKDENFIIIPYFSLFKTRNKRRVHKQETHIKKIIEELNQNLKNHYNN